MADPNDVAAGMLFLLFWSFFGGCAFAVWLSTFKDKRVGFLDLLIAISLGPIALAAFWLEYRRDRNANRDI